MDLNLYVIISFIAGIITLIAVVFFYISPKTKRITSLFYIRLSMAIMGISLILDAISALLLNIYFSIASAILLIPIAIFLSIGITYTIKESYYSINLIFISGFGVLLIYLTFQPGAVKLTKEEGIQMVSWVGLFGFISDILTFIILANTFYWGIKTWKNAPYLIKKEASIFFLGIIIMSIGIILVLPLRTYSHLLYLILIFTFSPLGLLIIIYAIIKEPKILYILPFTVHRILIKDKQGYPLFDYDWSESNISEMMFTGFINAVQVMSEDIMKIGGLVNINLEDGILIVNDSELITVGLVATKSSKLLRKILISFSEDFQHMFEKNLKASVKDMVEYESANVLIDKYFSNFPFKIIPHKKHPLILSGKYVKIPQELDNKLKNIFTDESEYELIKTELAKSPVCVPEEFMTLYDELKEEMDQISHKDSEDSDARLIDYE